MVGHQGEAFDLLIAGHLLLEGINAVGHHLHDALVLAQFLTVFECDTMFTGIFLQHLVFWYDECRHKLPFVSNHSNLLHKAVNQQFRFQRLRRDILTIRRFIQVLDTLLEEQFPVLQIAGITRMEETVFIECLSIESLAVEITLCDGLSSQQDLIILTDLHLYIIERTTNGTNRIRMTQAVTADSSQTLRESVAHNHVQANGMNKLLYLWRHRSTSRWEEVSLLQS